MARSFYPTYTEGTLHPECHALLERIAAGNGRPVSKMSPVEARQAFALPEWLGNPREDVAIRKVDAAGVPIRIYTPQGEPPMPVVVYFHGGGFVLGTLDDFEPFCTFLAAGARSVVVSVGYRLAPEHPFPAALDDAWTALRWVASNAQAFGGDAGRLAVAGDSAGGNLAAVVSMLARDHGAPRVAHQTLICPWVDLSTAAEDGDSFRHFGQGLWLSTAGIEWYRGHYLPRLELSEDPRVSPARAQRFSGLPSTHVLIAEFDVLADQGRGYAERLQAAGVTVTESYFRGMLHDFVTLPGLFTPAWQGIDEITASLRDAFAKG